MLRQDVESSDIATVGYEVNCNVTYSSAQQYAHDLADPLGTLEITFRKGGVYIYRDVPISDYRAILSAASIGREFYLRIKTKNYAYKKIA